MPTKAESPRITSSQQERGQAISDCVSQTMSERPGIERDQAVAICISMADRAMGTKEGSRSDAVKRRSEDRL